MKKGMAKAVDAAVAAIKEQSQKVNGTADIARVGTVSSGDENIGKLIAEAMEKVSADGVITIEESKTAETYSEVVEGMMFDRGYITPYMATDMEKMEAVVDDPISSSPIRRSPSSATSCPCWSRCCRAARSCSSSPRTWRVRPSAPCWSTV